MDKKAFRREISAKKRAMTFEQIEAASARLAEKFFETDAYKNARSIYAYLPYNQEIRTWSIVKRAFEDGKQVAVPKCYGEIMKFLWIEDLDHIAPGAFNIPEPIADEPEANDESALILMPGLAFDREGHRLGYGGGFYDRYLAEHHEHTLVALCYDFQLFDYIETEAHDIPVDLVISDL